MTLKQLKNRVHQYLDGIWILSERRGKARTLMYKWLATQMNIPKYQCHVKYFDRNQCEEAIKILKPIYIQIMGRDLDQKEDIKEYMSHLPETIHLVDTWELKSFLEFTDMNIMYDNRPKIEDLDLFRRQLRDEVDESTYKKLDDFIENYLKFYNK